ncbi:hypothetical protein EV284_3530 [Streptomyces sp. BK022]|uniref:hypothetical protein n=1 Tax=Streptomyces sp. BK022 TaxID=2512123 RepID=UPI00102A86D7|nr:hypothetical protein [Streptomyces sp. BK022]RZU36043.1 hypothetical protein EV284_3530 [Streptomyces sp. BK022]
MSIVTEVTSEHEATYRYLTDDDGDYYVSIKDVVSSLLSFSDKLEGMGGVYEQIGDAFTQVAVQLAEPFMQIETEAPVLSLLNTYPSGGAE